MESGEVPGSGTIAQPSSSRPHEEKKLRPETPLSPLMAQECPRPPSLDIMKRPAEGQVGRRVNLLSNHFRVSFAHIPDLFHYNVTISRSERDSPDPRYVTNKSICRKIMEKVEEFPELNVKNFAYDGDKSMFTMGRLTERQMEFIVVVDDVVGSRRLAGEGAFRDTDQTKKRRLDKWKEFKVKIKYAARITMRTIEAISRGEVCDNAQTALMALEIMLRQHASKRQCLLVGQSFFDWKFSRLMELGGGVTGCPGYHISFKPSQDGLFLNLDTSTTILIKQGPVIDFLLQNQGLNHPSCINWYKAKHVLKGVRIKTWHTNMEFRISGLSDEQCKHQRFLLKQRNEGDQDNEPQMVEVTVFNYFQSRGIDLQFSADLPCLDVGRKNRHNYLPIELCTILPGQRYTKTLSTAQRSVLVEKSRQAPAQRMQTLERAMESNDYNSDPVLRACNINVDKRLVALQGRVLPPPELKFGEQRDRRFGRETPTNGSWNFNQKTMFKGAKVTKWIIVNFSIRMFRNDQIRDIGRDLQRCCNRKGMEMPDYSAIVEETLEDSDMNPVDRVKAMRDRIRAKFPREEDRPRFMLCILPEKKTSDLYGPWKKMFLLIGVVNQCISPVIGKVNDQYLTYLALKINAKMDGLNTVLDIEIEKRIPKISTIPTIIIGMDVSRGSSGNLDSPSIAAVVSSRNWPLISRYRASARTQAPRTEMIEALYKPESTKEGEKDFGMMNELLKDFYQTCDRKPQRMIIFRGGVGESQFDKVLNNELKAILKACEFIERGYRPRVTFIVAQKNHHTKLFLATGQGNVQPGTIVDSHICHPRNFDFYLCPQSGRIGTSRPTHYHILLDENGFTVDELQSVVHALSYVYQRSTVAISSVAPINYAHLAASQMQQFLQTEERRERNIPDLPVPHPNISKTMFFC